MKDNIPSNFTIKEIVKYYEETLPEILVNKFDDLIDEQDLIDDIEELHGTIEQLEEQLNNFESLLDKEFNSVEELKAAIKNLID